MNWKRDEPQVVDKSLLVIIFFSVFLIVRCVILAAVAPSFYNFDETIITQLSSTPIQTFFNNVIAEPLPFGFYYLIRIFPLNNVVLSKLFLTLVSGFIILSALVYAHKNKLFEKAQLTWGVAFFLGSGGMLSIFSILKQDSISIPLLFLSIMVSLNILIRKETSKFNLVLLLLSINLILLFSYFNYAIAFLQAIVVLLLIQDHRGLKRFLIVSFSVIGVYLYLYGFRHIITFITRWGKFGVSEDPNSLINSLSYFFIGFGAVNIWSDLVIVLVSMLFLYFLLTHSLKKILYFYTLALLVFIGIISYFLNFYVEVRYSIAVYLFISFVIGWSVDRLVAKNIKYRFPAAAGTTVFIIVNLFIWSKSLVEEQQMSLILQKYLAPINGEQTGFISDFNVLPVVLANSHNLDHQVVPVVPTIFGEEGRGRLISRRLLLSNEQKTVKLQEDIASNLKESGINDYLYLMLLQKAIKSADNDRMYLQILLQSCKFSEVRHSEQSYVLISFKDCFTG